MNVIVVMPELTPGFAYTRDASAEVGHEFVLAGRVDLDPEEARELLLEAVADFPDGSGRFVFRPVLKDWADVLLLAVPDERRASAVQVVQVGSELLTEPRCDQPLPTAPDTAWWFLERDRWGFPIPVPSWLTTTPAILRGARPVTFERWEEDYWEMLDKPSDEVDPDEAVVIPLACMLDLGYDIEDAVGRSVRSSDE